MIRKYKSNDHALFIEIGNDERLIGSITKIGPYSRDKLNSGKSKEIKLSSDRKGLWITLEALNDVLEDFGLEIDRDG